MTRAPGAPLLRVDVVTVFPDYLAPLELSLVGRARRAGLLEVAVHDLRQWTTDRHRTVDDSPYGGGAGMVMRPEPWGAALDALAPPGSPATLVVPSPAGVPFTQSLATDLAGRGHLVIACGRYEGIDARVVADAARRVPVVETSVGDVVLAGGEAAALVVVEATARLLPGVLGNPESLTEESHAVDDPVLEYPLYTRPPVWRDLEVPAELLSGHHASIAAWRRHQALARTAAVRPDLLAALDPATLGAADLDTLAGLGWAPGPDGRLAPGRGRPVGDSRVGRDADGRPLPQGTPSGCPSPDPVVPPITHGRPVAPREENP